MTATGCSRIARLAHLEPTWQRWYRIGVQEFERHNFQQAEAAFAEAKRLNPRPSRNFVPDLYMAGIYLAVQRFEYAEAALERVRSSGVVQQGDREWAQLERLRAQLALRRDILTSTPVDAPVTAAPPTQTPVAPIGATILPTPPPRADNPDEVIVSGPGLPVVPSPEALLPGQMLGQIPRSTPLVGFPRVSAGSPAAYQPEVLPAPVVPPTAEHLPTLAPPERPPTGSSTALFLWILLGLGTLLLLLIFTAAIWIPNPSEFQRTVFRTVLALGVSLVAASIPWFAGGPSGGLQTAGVTASALGLFLLVFLFDPTRRVWSAHPVSGHLGPISAGSIFVSYRRADTEDIVGRLCERLYGRFGQGAVFKDVDTLIPGLDFREQLGSALKNCRIALAVIGPKWESSLELHRAQGDEDRDFVVIEIGSALKRQIPVIPILVQQASLPATAALPPALESLRYRQALPLRADPDFSHDIERVIQAIEQLLARGQVEPASLKAPRS